MHRGGSWFFFCWATVEEGNDEDTAHKCGQWIGRGGGKKTGLSVLGDTKQGKACLSQWRGTFNKICSQEREEQMGTYLTYRKGGDSS